MYYLLLTTSCLCWPDRARSAQQRHCHAGTRGFTGPVSWVSTHLPSKKAPAGGWALYIRTYNTHFDLSYLTRNRKGCMNKNADARDGTWRARTAKVRDTEVNHLASPMDLQSGALRFITFSGCATQAQYWKRWRKDNRGCDSNRDDHSSGHHDCCNYHYHLYPCPSPDWAPC